MWGDIFNSSSFESERYCVQFAYRFRYLHVQMMMMIGSLVAFALFLSTVVFVPLLLTSRQYHMLNQVRVFQRDRGIEINGRARTGV